MSGKKVNTGIFRDTMTIAREFVANVSKDEIFQLMCVEDSKSYLKIESALKKRLPKSKYIDNVIIQKDNHMLICYVRAKSYKTHESKYYEILVNVNYGLRNNRCIEYCIETTESNYRLASSICNTHRVNKSRYC